MVKSIKGTKTEKHLLESFAGESQARMRYTYFASKAKKEGFEQIFAVFMEIADNEKEHAKRFFKFLEGGFVEITGTFPAGIISSTIENLRFSATGENEEHSKIYPEAARIADEEGFPEVAECFRRVAIAEKHHEARYLTLLNNLENGRVFKKGIVVRWRCRNCGYVYESKEAFEKCPACLHPKAYMEELSGSF
ncbi:rubrerythrin [Endomicrobiia bacterium]|uniref:rubrerythrin n=1 Tax=Endomicrobium trichonymphae TaxID=1408204 RepID=UPI0008661DC4|nr:rubrerythrin family protein [Candidatus Endomicrobium trichonymphae]GHT06384.1 rubrerythrin [Endomicrobiia bacterium]BAV58826.1 rubrerythrin [Candidatus Endomicrobium trichonymphae]GHT12498.1 rubrerythrin [Endomicrobiia bacterium]GHT20056.1 rubrerythrin [Endomicrobiia bacterium]GHT23050.1 rubrerythrin [Endomicrobiia bacterium]